MNGEDGEYAQLVQMLANELFYLQHGDMVKCWVEEIMARVDTLLLGLGEDAINNLLSLKFENRNFSIYQALVHLHKSAQTDA